MNRAKEIWRGVGERLAVNYRGFWVAYWAWVAVLVLGLLCDMGSTMHFMLADGVEMELHFFVRLAGRLFGPVAGPVIAFFGKAGAGLLVAVYCRKYAPWIFGAAAAISFWAAWYNVWGT